MSGTQWETLEVKKVFELLQASESCFTGRGPLAFEQGEKDVLERKLRPPDERILSSLMIQRTLLVGSFMGFGTFIIYYLQVGSGVSVNSARSVALTTMVFF